MKIDDKLLAQAFINNNNQFMESLPTNMEIHSFPNSFERKMKHLILADKKYGGKLWVEKLVSYSTKAAVIILCLVTLNLVTVKALDLNIWDVIFTKTQEFFNIKFDKSKDDIVVTDTVRLQIVNIPDGYKQRENYQSKNLSVQSFTSDNGTITYTESLISETADINMEAGESSTQLIGNWQVSYITGEDNITAFFTDAKYYHIVEIQGSDANKDFAKKIIEELEEQ